MDDESYLYVSECGFVPGIGPLHVESEEPGIQPPEASENPPVVPTEGSPDTAEE